MKKRQRIGCAIVVSLMAVAALTVLINRVAYRVGAGQVIETYDAIKASAAGGKQPVRFRACPQEGMRNVTPGMFRRSMDNAAAMRRNRPQSS